MVLAIVGDVEADEVFTRAQEAFGKIARQPDPDPVVTVEPQQEGERRVIQKFDAEPYLSIAYHKTGFSDPDEIMYRVLHRLLADGRTSRLYKSLVIDQQLATSVSTYEFPGSQSGDLDPNVFVIDVEPKSPHTTEECEKALYAELDRVAATAADPKELEKIKNRIESDFIWAMYSNLGLANQLAEYEARAGDWRYLLTIRERLAKVTADDIMRVAKKTFTPDNRTVATLVPSGGEQTNAE